MIDLLPSADEAALAEVFARVVRDEFPVSRHLPQQAATHPVDPADQARWPLIAELGWLALSLPEGHGEVSYTLPEQVLAFRELGRGLITPVLFTSILGAEVAARAGQTERCAAIVAGQIKVAPAIRRPGGTDASSIYLLDAEGCELALLWDQSGAALHELSAFADIKPVRAVDETMSLHTARPGPAVAQLESADLFNRISLLLAAQLAGMAEAACDMGVAYAGEREQFGQRIGAFQAIKHHCTNMRLRAEVAWAQTLLASLSADDPAFIAHASSAQLLGADAAIKNAAANVQIHGAMGFTAECAGHLYMKRAHTLDLMAGPRLHHHARILTDVAML